ncbi:MAG: class I tRNA ligase family protein [Candidatus Paceibacterota bacterium]
MSDQNQEKSPSSAKATEGQGKKSDIAKREEVTLEFWRDNNIFEKTLAKESPKGEFVFYDGPPFATGLPHYGHILPGTIKDVIPRFKTMQGYHVERQWGWDTHGLPLENQVEDHLGLETKKDISEYGIEKFNEVAKDFVLQYAEDWKRIIPRTGRWVDMDNDYRTMDSSYTESIWWAFSELDKKDLVYEGFKSMHVCPRCETPLSNFEVNQGYVEQKDIAVTVKLPLADAPDTSLLIWTTTPWTLPGNMAVAVNPELEYVKVVIPENFDPKKYDLDVDFESGGYIFSKEAAQKNEGKLHKLLFLSMQDDIDSENFSGEKLIGKIYQSPFSYFQDKEIENKAGAWQVYGADFVTLEEGTGLVHIAPAFGADDLSLAEDHGIPIVHHVTESGEFTADVTDFAGMKVKPRDEGNEEHLSADIEILRYLLDKDLLFNKENLHHQYPLCWRCETPLLNYATTSWFVEVSSFKDDLVAANENVGWVPKAIGSNRFGNWLEGARDWAISRERFWGAPLPVWKSADGEVVEVISSLADLKEKTKSSNKFFAMRHGEADHNIKRIMSSLPSNEHHLTNKGKEEVREAITKLEDIDIDFVFVSPMLRTKETAEMVKESLDLSTEQIIIDERFTENKAGILEGKKVEKWHEVMDDLEPFSETVEGGETYTDIRTRMLSALFDINESYQDKNILIISHGLPLRIMQWTSELIPNDEIITRRRTIGDMDTGSILKLDFWPYPHNGDFELDFHRPYIDEVTWEENGKEMQRIDSVFDCWFESGSMSYASKHYPFENDDFSPDEGKGYPANFISEGLDQTRGWFYSSLVLGVGLFGKSPYENVIVNGLVMAEDGQKMSKSKGNYPPVTDILNNQGADALRFFLVNSPLVRGENVSLSTDEVDEVVKKVMYRLTNTFSFIEMYTTSEERETARTKEVQVENVLDRWIMACLRQLIGDVTAGLGSYQIDKATKPIVKFIDDLSTWYVRRSRDRIRGEDGADRDQAINVTLHVLREVSKVLAPFMPFLAEEIYRDVSDGSVESVHLTDWPTADGNHEGTETLLADMRVLREAVSHAHDRRSQAELKVRQPLAKLTLRDDRLAGKDELLEILADEVNVEEIHFDTEIDEPAVLDTDLTDELKRKGVVREFIRTVQRLRKQADLDPAAEIMLGVETDATGRELLEAFTDDITDTATVAEISFTDVDDGDDVAEHGFFFTAKIL